MAHTTFSLSWDSHRNNICNGLSSLQQNEEFVDMTLAADGHRVKVHQMIMALASPYIKDLISSASCPHPIIFLNKISYQTLSAILEYIYTGEALVSLDNLTDLIEAAKALHIKGLEEMDIDSSVKGVIKSKLMSRDVQSKVDNDELYFEVAVSEKASPSQHSADYTVMDEGMPEDSQSPGPEAPDDDGMVVEEEITGDIPLTPTAEKHVQIVKYAPAPSEKSVQIVRCTSIRHPDRDVKPVDENIPATMQYTISNQGSLQMILNRYMYYLKHSNRNNTRQWRCVDYLNNSKCPALVVTKDDVVIQRISAHSHPFHDKRILKKVYSNAVFTALHEAEKKGIAIKCTRSKENNDE